MDTARWTHGHSVDTDRVATTVGCPSVHIATLHKSYPIKYIIYIVIVIVILMKGLSSHPGP